MPALVTDICALGWSVMISNTVYGPGVKKSDLWIYLDCCWNSVNLEDTLQAKTIHIKCQKVNQTSITSFFLKWTVFGFKFYLCNCVIACGYRYTCIWCLRCMCSMIANNYTRNILNYEEIYKNIYFMILNYEKQYISCFIYFWNFTKSPNSIIRTPP